VNSARPGLVGSNRASPPSSSWAMSQTNERQGLAAEPVRSSKWAKRRGPRGPCTSRLRASGPWTSALGLQSAWSP